MNGYISKESVLNLIEYNDKVCHYADERYENVVYATTQTICKVVAEMPTADIQPVKRGKWEGVDYDTFFKCSECGHMTDWQRYKYCPYCGARMDGD